MVIKGATKVIFQIIVLCTLCFLTCCAKDSTTTVAQTLHSGIYPTASISPSFIVTAVNISISTTAPVLINATSTNVTFTSSIQPTTTPTSPMTPTPQSDKGEDRRFDGLSFFGGMILGAAVCVILFFALKYYRAKKRSYHSL